MKILGLDPGVTTGWAIYQSPSWNPAAYELVSGQLGPGEHHNKLYSLLNRERPDVVVLERFQFRRQGNAVLTPVEYIGVCELYCQLTNTRLIYQTPSQGKAFWDNDKLKALGRYKASSPHAMDAIRHVLAYVVKIGVGLYLLQELRPAARGPVESEQERA